MVVLRGLRRALSERRDAGTHFSQWITDCAGYPGRCHPI